MLCLTKVDKIIDQLRYKITFHLIFSPRRVVTSSDLRGWVNTEEVISSLNGRPIEIQVRQIQESKTIKSTSDSANQHTQKTPPTCREIDLQDQPARQPTRKGEASSDQPHNLSKTRTKENACYQEDDPSDTGPDTHEPDQELEIREETADLDELISSNIYD